MIPAGNFGLNKRDSISVAKIDVLLPTYNSAKYLKSAVDSIRKQTVSDIRIIIIDDGSTDATGSLIEEMKAIDPRIVYHHQENAGIVAALNNGLELCNAPYIARMDGDDISYPDRFEKELVCLEANPDYVAVSGLARHIDSEGKFLGTISTRKEAANANACALPAAEPYLLHPMLMVRRDAIKRAGGYRYVYQSEDSDLYWRLSDTGSLYVLPDIVGDYRMHSGSVSAASIIHGRQAAIWSQLAALSEQRRREGRPDCEFSPEQMETVKIQTVLHLIARSAEQTFNLNDSEILWFRSAVSAKFLELCYYRPYDPDKTDVQFILNSINSDTDIFNRPDYAKFRESIISASVRMLLSGRWKDALTLATPRRWPTLFARVFFRVAIPGTIKQWIKTAAGR